MDSQEKQEHCGVCGKGAEACAFEVACSCWYGKPCCSCPDRLHCDRKVPHPACVTCADCLSATPATCIGFIPNAAEDYKRIARNRKARANRKARHDALTSLGLVRVKGALGGTYYE